MCMYMIYGGSSCACDGIQLVNKKTIYIYGQSDIDI